MSVYFITARDLGRVKIGCASNVRTRLAGLQTSSSVELKLEAVLDGSQEEERELHARFADHRVRGEWFTICNEIEALMESAGTSLAAEAGDVPARRRAMTDEELADESIRREHQMFAECMAWRERHDPERNLPLTRPGPDERAA